MLVKKSSSLNRFIVLAWVVMEPVPVVGATAPKRQEQLEEVIITAQRREQSLQSAPVAVSALSAAQLQQLGIHSLDALTDGAVPSLRIMPFPTTPSTLVMTIRGNGPLDIGQITREGSVAIYLDGIYLGRAQGFAAEVADLDRIEVLRGPQGTLFGRNSTGGAVSLVSKQPSGEFGLEQAVGIGSYDEKRSVTHLNLPAAGSVRAKIDYLYAARDGWVRNTAPGEADFDAYEKRGGRIALNWQPRSDLDIDYSFDRSKTEITQNYYQLYEDNIGIVGVEPGRQGKTRYPIRPLEPTITNQALHRLVASWDANEQWTFKSLTGWRTLNERTFSNFGGALYNGGLVMLSDIAQDQLSQELQWLGRSRSVDWVAGLYYYREHAKETLQDLFSLDIFGALAGAAPLTPIIPPTNISPTPGPTFGLPVPIRIVHAAVDSRAVYGQATWTPPLWGERLHATLGARYTEDRKTGNRTEIGYSRFNLKTHHIDPQVTVSYDWMEALSTYLKWSSAYKSGGVNSRATDFSAYKPEQANTWEAGLKTEFWQRRARLNIALFSTDYKDMQVDVIDPMMVVITETINATDRVRVKGAELDFMLAPSDGLRLGLSYTYLDGDFPPQENPLAGGADQRLVLTQTPRHAGAATVDYTFSPWRFGTLTAHVDATSTARYAYVAFGRQHMDAYTLINARLTLASIPLTKNAGDLKLSLWGRNLTDEEYVVFSTAVNEPPAAIVQVYGTPRTAGVELTYEY